MKKQKALAPVSARAQMRLMVRRTSSTCLTTGFHASICAKIQTETLAEIPQRLTDLVAHDEAGVVGPVDGPSAAGSGRNGELDTGQF